MLLRIPVRCFNGHIFGFEGFDIHPSATLTIEDCTAGPCPTCGGRGLIVNGVYSFTEALLTTARLVGIDSIKALQAIFTDAQQNGSTPDQVADRLRREPEKVRSLADLLPQNRAEWATWIGVIVAIFGVVIPMLSASSGGTTNITINQLTIQNIFNQVIAPQTPQTQPARRTTPKIGRNDPCHCGSQRKKKVCHPD